MVQDVVSQDQRDGPHEGHHLQDGGGHGRPDEGHRPRGHVLRGRAPGGRGGHEWRLLTTFSFLVRETGLRLVFSHEPIHVSPTS